MHEGKLWQFFTVIGVLLGAFITFCALVWACIAIRRAIERRRALADEGRPLLTLEEEPIAEEPVVEEDVSPTVTPRAVSAAEEALRRAQLELQEKIATVPAVVGGDLAEGKVRQVLDLKLVADSLALSKLWRTNDDPRKKHKNLVFVEPHYNGSWDSVLFSPEAAHIRMILNGYPSRYKVPEEYKEKLVYAMLGTYRLTGCKDFSAACVKMKFPSGEGLGESGLGVNELKEEIKKSFRALFDVLLTSSACREKALFLPVPDFCSFPHPSFESGMLYREAYAAGLGEAMNEFVETMSVPSVDPAKGNISIFQQCLGISCVYVCDPNPKPEIILEKLMQVPQFVPVGSTAMGSASPEQAGRAQGHAIS